jgi:MFS family permease
MTLADSLLSLAAVAELVPNKHRGNAQAALDLVTLPWSVFGSLLGNVMVKYSHLSFRINFIIGVILNVLSITSIWFFYHPVSSCPIPIERCIFQAGSLDLHNSHTRELLFTYEDSKSVS